MHLEELSNRWPVEDKYRERLKSKGVKLSYADADGVDESFSETDSESDEEEDDDGDLATPAINAQILKTLAEIRTRDSKIYDPSVNFFSPEEVQRAKSEWRAKQQEAKPQKPMRLKDFHRQRLLAQKDGESTDEEEERAPEPVKSHQEEQQELLNAFKNAARDSEDQDTDLLKLRPKNAEQIAQEEEDYKNFLLENLAHSQNARESMNEWFQQGGKKKSISTEENFLVEYILNRGWVDKERKALPTYDQIIDEDEAEAEDEGAVEKMEEFEEKYNFRFEQPNADQIVTYSRDIEGSVRRKDSKRREQRAARKTRKEEEKARQREELKRLKNLRNLQIQEKLARIQQISGNTKIADIDLALESDFDPEEHDRKMGSLFDDQYYGNDDGSKPEFGGENDDGEKEDGAVDSKMQSKIIQEATKAVSKISKKSREKGLESLKRKKLNKYLEEYYQLDYEDMIGDLPCRFKYQSVPSTAFGLKVTDIVLADDEDLDNHASLKKLAPYLPPDVQRHNQEKYAHKRRLHKFYDLQSRKALQPPEEHPIRKKKA